MIRTNFYFGGRVTKVVPDITIITVAVCSRVGSTLLELSRVVAFLGLEEVSFVPASCNVLT